MLVLTMGCRQDRSRLPPEESLYLIYLDRGPEDQVPLGTAWVAGRSRLVTAAHVADALSSALPGDRAMVVNPLSKVPIPVQRAISHRGYLDHAELLERYRPDLSPNAVLALENVRFCDIAILEVDGVLDNPLEIAPPRDLESLASNATATVFGFELADQALYRFSLDNLPPVSTKAGRIDSVQTFFDAAGDADERLKIRFQRGVAKGMSGSPVLDQKGRVLAIVTASPDVSDMAYGSILQRADLVTEMLDGSMPEAQDGRRRRWGAAFSSRLLRPEESVLAAGGIDWRAVDERLLRRWVGQLFVVGIGTSGGDAADVSFASYLVDEVGVGGLAMTWPGFPSTLGVEEAREELMRRNSLLQQKALLVSRGFPILLGYGGNVSDLGRDLSPIATEIPVPLALGSIGSRRQIRGAGALVARELLALGFNFGFVRVAPSGDEAQRLQVGDQVFSDNATQASVLATSFLRGVQDTRLVGVARYLPDPCRTKGRPMVEPLGAGGLPRQTRQLFSELVQSRVQAVQTSFPETDRTTSVNPLCDSKQALEILRARGLQFSDATVEGLGFGGLLLSKDLLDGLDPPAPRIRARESAPSSRELVLEKAIQSFESPQGLLFLSRVFRGGSTPLSPSRTPKITLEEFEWVLDGLEVYIFEHEDPRVRASRIERFKMSLLRSFHVRAGLIGLLREPRSGRAFREMQHEFSHPERARRLFRESVFVSTGETRWVSLGSAARGASEVVVLKTRPREDQTRDLIAASPAGTLVAELSAELGALGVSVVQHQVPWGDEWDDAGLRALAEEVSDTAAPVVFEVQSEEAWRLAFDLLSHLEADTGILERLYIVVSASPTLMKQVVASDLVRRRLARAHLVVGYSGGKSHLRRLAQFLVSEDEPASNAPPLEVEGVLPMPGWRIRR